MIFRWHCFQFVQRLSNLLTGEGQMLAGTVVSAVLGGMVGLAYAVSQGHGVLLSLLSYQIGGIAAVLTFVARSGLALSCQD
jgi:uncharacterized protein YcfJ